MRDLTQKFRRVPLFLERITFVGATDNFDISRNELPFLSFALRRDQRAAYDNRCAGTEPLDLCVVRQSVPGDNLKITERRAVIQFDERKIFRIAPGADPSLDLQRIDWYSAL